MAEKELFGISEQLNDTISRQAAIDAFLTELTKRERKNFLHTWSTVEVKYFVADMFEKLPSAQQERKKGKWIYHPEIGWGDTWLCDQCGEKTTSTVMGKPRANYCPMCGADMRGEQDE